MDNNTNGPIRSANYSGSKQRKLTGLEHMMDSNSVLPFHIAEYWQWAYSDMLRNTQRGVFAEFVVKSALELGGIRVNDEIRSNFEPYDLVGPIIYQRSTSPRLDFSNIEFSYIPCRIEVKSAAYLQAWEPHKGTVPKISFSIAPARLPDETGDYKIDSPKYRNSDLYVFTVYAAKEKEQNILNMNLWRFYVIKTSVLDAEFGEQKTVSLARLQALGCTELAYSDLCKSIQDACDSITADNKKDHPIG